MGKVFGEDKKECSYKERVRGTPASMWNTQLAWAHSMRFITRFVQKKILGKTDQSNIYIYIILCEDFDLLNQTESY